VVGYLAGSLASRGRGISSTTARAATSDGQAVPNLEAPPAAVELPPTDQPSSATCSHGTESKNAVPSFVEELVHQLAPELKSAAS
jgi:hypothetical protein